MWVWHLVLGLITGSGSSCTGPFDGPVVFWGRRALRKDFFEVFGLPRKLGIDAAELQRRFYALAREHHPDFHQAAPPEELARVEAASALVNAAYRTLRDPIARVDYLVRLEEGRETKEGAADWRILYKPTGNSYTVTYSGAFCDLDYTDGKFADWSFNPFR